MTRLATNIMISDLFNPVRCPSCTNQQGACRDGTADAARNNMARNASCSCAALVIMSDRLLGGERTAAAVPYLRQARAARRRPIVVAAQREAPEQTPAAVEGAEQGCAVLLIGRRNRIPASVLDSRSVLNRQELPAACDLHSVPTSWCRTA